MNDALGLLGLIYKAKKLVLGEEILKQISKVKLLIIASDISSASRSRFEKKCFYYDIEMIDCYNSKQISNSLGKNNVKVVGITDQGFVKSFKKKMIKE